MGAYDNQAVASYLCDWHTGCHTHGEGCITQLNGEVVNKPAESNVKRVIRWMVDIQAKIMRSNSLKIL